MTRTLAIFLVLASMAIFGATKSARADTLLVTPPSLNFGTEQVGMPGFMQSVQVINTGTETVAMMQPTLTGDIASFFVLNDNCYGALAAGESCQITVQFHPMYPGIHSAEMFVHSEGSAMIPVQMMGNGFLP